MTPIQLDHTAKVLAEMLTFKQPADAVLSGYFREHKKLGRQDRHEIAETAFAALRHYQKISAVLRRPHAQPRKAALAALILGRSTNISQIKDLLDEEETEFLSGLKARKTEFSDDLHTAAELPQWLVEQLQRRRNPRLRPQHQPSRAARHPRQHAQRQTRQSADPASSRKPRCGSHALFPLGHPPEKQNRPQQTRIVFRRHTGSPRRRQPAPRPACRCQTRRNHCRFLRRRRRQNPRRRCANGKQRQTSPKNALPTSSPA